VPVAASTAEMRQATDRMIDLKARADAALSGVQQIRGSNKPRATTCGEMFLPP